MSRAAANAVVQLAYKGTASTRSLQRAASAVEHPVAKGVTVELDDAMLKTLRAIATGRRAPGLARLGRALVDALTDAPRPNGAVAHSVKQGAAASTTKVCMRCKAAKPVALFATPRSRLCSKCARRHKGGSIRTISGGLPTLGRR